MPKVKKEVTEEIPIIEDEKIENVEVKEEPKKEVKKSGTVACF